MTSKPCTLPQSAAQTAGRVLVVDDHAQARESMADVLRQAGHQVECLASAVEALEDAGARKLRRDDHRSANAGHDRPGIVAPSRAASARGPDGDGHGPRLGCVGRRRHAARGVRLHRKAIGRGPARTTRRPRDSAWPHAGPPPGFGSDRQRWPAGDDRLQPVDASPADAHRPGGAHGGNRADHRRERHRQGTRRPGRACRQSAAAALRW